MYIKIVRCSSNRYWYKDHIGEIYETAHEEPDEDGCFKIKGIIDYGDGTAGNMYIGNEDCCPVPSDEFAATIKKVSLLSF